MYLQLVSKASFREASATKAWVFFSLEKTCPLELKPGLFVQLLLSLKLESSDSVEP